MKVSIRLVGGIVLATSAGIISIYVLWTLDTGVGARPGELIHLTPSGAVSDNAVLPFKQVPVDLFPDDTSKNPIDESSDQTSLYLLFREHDTSAGHENGTRIRVTQMTNQFNMNFVAKTESIEANEITVALQFGDGYGDTFTATWNEVGIGFEAEFVHLTEGNVDALTASARESYMSTVRSLIPRLATP
jgi:hypothetical protein